MDKQKSLESALASTEMEGINLDKDIVELIEESIEKNGNDTSLLNLINKLLEEKNRGKTK